MCIENAFKVYIDQARAFKLFAVDKEGKLCSPFYRDSTANEHKQLFYETNNWIDFIPSVHYHYGFYAFNSLNPIKHILDNQGEWDLLHFITKEHKYVVLPVILTGEIYQGTFFDNINTEIAYYSNKIYVCDSPKIRARIKNLMKDNLWSISYVS
jgi:hypothetical protein